MSSSAIWLVGVRARTSQGYRGRVPRYSSDSFAPLATQLDAYGIFSLSLPSNPIAEHDTTLASGSGYRTIDDKHQIACLRYCFSTSSLQNYCLFYFFLFGAAKNSQPPSTCTLTSSQLSSTLSSLPYLRHKRY